LFVVLTLLVALTVGWFAVVEISRAQYATLKSSINAVVSSGLRNPNTALSNALYVVQRDDYNLDLVVVFPSNETTPVSKGTVTLSGTPTIADVHASLDRAVSVANLPGFVIRSLDVGGGDYLVVAGSTSDITKQNEHLALTVALAALVVALLSLALAREVTRRDFRTMAHLIDYAGDVASGHQDEPAPPVGGSKDLQELREALVVMVESLQERIAHETRNAEAMQQFINDASHELRTPLTVVKGYNELLASGQASGDVQKRAVSRMQREVHRMEDLVRDLLLLAQLGEAPRHALERVNLSDVVTQRVAEFALEHPERVVTQSVAPALAVNARPEFVDRFFNNAFTNVLRYTPESAPLSVTLESQGSHVVLFIDDGGPGLPIYGERPQRFQRFDESRSRETGGSGLGMSIMADVAESLGGAMATSKSPLGGLRLTFRLPRAN
jgi:signal transduction histidine kinase